MNALRRWTVAVLLLLVAVTAACPVTEPRHESGPPPMAPDFELRRIDGQLIRLAELRGSVVILDFWATWCGPCEVQMPVLDALWRDRDGRNDPMIIGLSVDTDPVAEVAEWVAARELTYPIAMASQDLAMRFGVFGYPTLLIIDPEGRIHKRHIGVLSRPEIESILEEIRLTDQAGG
jgi:peroxiredoxin